MTVKASGQLLSSGQKLSLLLIIVLGGTVAIGALAVSEPLLAIGALSLTILSLAMLVWPDVVTLAVVFVLYTNAAVVAVRFHGVPFLVAAVVPGLLLFPMGYHLVFRREKLVVDKILPLMVVLLIIHLVGTLFAQEFDVALENTINFGLEGLALYFLILNTVRTPKMLRLVVRVLVIAGLFMGGLSFYQQVTQTYDRNYAGFAQMSDAAFGTGEENILGEVEQPRLAGPLGQQNRYAQIMLMLAPLAFFQFWGAKSKSLSLLAAVATGLILVGAVLTFSRGAAVGLALVLVVMAFMRYIKLHQLILVFLGLAVLLQAFPQYGARLSSLQALTDLVTNDETIASADGSVRSRATENLAAVLMFVDHPVTGVGPGMYPEHYQEYAERVGIRVLNTTRESHNLYLGMAAESGVIGLLSFLLIIYLTLRDLARRRRRLWESSPEMANIATGLFLAIVTFLTTSLFLHFAFIRFFWLIMGVAGAMIHVFDPATKPAFTPETISPQEREDKLIPRRLNAHE